MDPVAKHPLKRTGQASPMSSSKKCAMSVWSQRGEIAAGTEEQQQLRVRRHSGRSKDP